jgi:hypothetical protein
MNTRKASLIFGAITFVLVTLACTLNVGGPNYPTPSIPVSTEAAGELLSSMGTEVAAGAVSGEITITFTEPQLTSYLYYKLQSQVQPVITNPQVFLRDGQIQVFGTASKGYFTASSRIILSAGIDELGQLKIELTSADFGPVPVPSGLKDLISTTIQEVYTGAIGPIATGIRLQSVTIMDGTMTIVGQIK